MENWPKKWEKSWQTNYGTAEFSMSVDPYWLWRKQQEEEEQGLEDWEMVDVPPYEEMKRFHGTKPPPKRTDPAEEKEQDQGDAKASPSDPAAQEKDVKDDAVVSPSIAERRKQVIPPVFSISDNMKEKAGQRELYACKRCDSYHYIDSCIYRLPEDEWLEYHPTYMSTQPTNPDKDEDGLAKKTKNRMTGSGKKMLLEDREWRRKTMLQRGRQVPKDPSGALLKQEWESAERQGGTEEEDDELVELAGFSTGKGKGKQRASE